MSNEKYIGIFDSGFGGLSVLRILAKKFPYENFIYYADSINAPYGVKDKKTIIELAKESTKKLLNINPNIKLFVLACNTVTVSAMDELKKEFPKIQIIGTSPNFSELIKPLSTIKSKTSTIQFIDKKIKVDIKSSKKILLILCTRATKDSKYLQNEIKKYSRFFEIRVVSAPEIVNYVENNQIKSSDCDEYIKNILYNQKNIDYLMLACTHFPFAIDIIKKYINEEVIIIDNGKITANNVCNYIKNDNKATDNNKRYIKIIDTKGGYEREKTYMELLENKDIKFINFSS